MENMENLDKMHIVRDDEGNEIGVVVPLEGEVKSAEEKDANEMAEMEALQAKSNLIQQENAKREDEAAKLKEELLAQESQEDIAA